MATKCRSRSWPRPSAARRAEVSPRGSAKSAARTCWSIPAAASSPPTKKLCFWRPLKMQQQIDTSELEKKVNSANHESTARTIFWIRLANLLATVHELLTRELKKQKDEDK